jgi:predicted nuclease of predicted toxin-antitoxin system
VEGAGHFVRLKLDENLSRHLKQVFAGLGHDVKTAAEENLLSQPDTAVALAAKTESRLLLTLDVEFGDLRKHPPGNHPGIVLFRPRTFGPLTVNEFIREFVAGADLRNFEGCVVVVEPSRVRVRRPLIPTRTRR